MGVVLIVDTSSSFSLSLFCNDNLLGCIDNSNRLCSNSIVSYINEMLNNASISVNDIDYLGVSVGPGSYTGIRVGYSFSLGLCQALNKKMVVFNILEAVYSYLKDIYIVNIVYPIINANNNNLFTLVDGVVTKISIFEFQKLLVSVRNPLVVLLDSVYDECFSNSNIKIVRISNICEAVYYFVRRNIDGKKFCDIRKYRVDYFDD